MKYLYWAVATIVVIIGVGLSVYLGQETVNIPKIVYNSYRDPGQFAEAITANMKSELQKSPLVLLGVMPGSKVDLEFWKSFFNLTAATELQYQVVIIDPGLPFAEEFFPRAMKMDLKKDIVRFIEGAKNAQAQGLRMAVIVPSIYASQLLQSNPAERIKQNSDLQLTSFSVISFPRSMEQEVAMEIPCVMGQNDRNGEGALGCAVQKKARLLYRQKSKPGYYEGVIDQVGDRDYLVLFNAP